MNIFVQRWKIFSIVISICPLPILSRSYSVKAEVKDPKGKAKLNPNYVSGFSDGESSFVISMYKKKGYKTGWHVNPVFAIQLHTKDLPLLYRIKDFFGGRNYIFKKTEKFCSFSVNSLSDLINVIIPHFDKYPLL